MSAATANASSSAIEKSSSSRAVEGRQRREIGTRQRPQHARLEAGMRADAIGNSRQAGPVPDQRRRLLADAGAAIAGQGRWIGHRPPSMASSRMPWSGRLGSLSSLAISSRCIVICPAAVASLCGSSIRWKAVTRTDATPSRRCAAAINGLT